MAYPISTTEALAIVPNLIVSTTDTSVDNTSLTDLILSKTQQVQEVVYPRRYKNNNYSSPTDHQKDIINLCSQVKIWNEIIGRRLTNVSENNYLYLNKFLSTLDSYLSKALFCNYFYSSFKTDKLAQVQLATALECSYNSPSCPTPSTNTKPSSTTIDIWCKQWSSVVYSYAKQLGNFVTPSNINDLPSKVANYYADCVSMIVGSLITIVRSTEYQDPKAMYQNATKLWLDGLQLIENLRLNKVLFIPDF